MASHVCTDSFTSWTLVKCKLLKHIWQIQAGDIQGYQGSIKGYSKTSKRRSWKVNTSDSSVCVCVCVCVCERERDIARQHSNRILTVVTRSVTFCSDTLKSAHGNNFGHCQYSYCPQRHTLPTFRRMFLHIIAP